MITAREFAEAAHQLAAAWQRCLPEQPQWRWVPSQRPFAASLGGGHLARTFTLAAEVPAALRGLSQPQPQPKLQQPDGDESPTVSCASLSSDMDEADAADPASAAGTSAALSTRAVDVTVHVAFHPSYRVPVLYFEVVSQRGELLGLDAALAALPRLRQAVAQGQPYTVATREEHVVLGRPVFMLHPCQTEAVMLLLRRGAGANTGEARSPPGAAAPAAAEPGQRLAPLRYLLAWLSVAGQPLDLEVPAALWLAATQQRPREQAAG